MSAVSLVLVMSLPVIFFIVSAVAVGCLQKWMRKQTRQPSVVSAKKFGSPVWLAAQLK